MSSHQIQIYLRTSKNDWFNNLVENLSKTPKVFVGGKECAVNSGTTGPLIKCKVNVDQELAIGLFIQYFFI